jgi:hypothetical protein
MLKAWPGDTKLEGPTLASALATAVHTRISSANPLNGPGGISTPGPLHRPPPGSNRLATVTQRLAQGLIIVMVFRGAKQVSGLLLVIRAACTNADRRHA